MDMKIARERSQRGNDKVCGQSGTEAPENKKLANMYIQLTRNRGLEFQTERRMGGCKLQEALREIIDKTEKMTKLESAKSSAKERMLGVVA